MLKAGTARLHSAASTVNEVVAAVDVSAVVFESVLQPVAASSKARAAMMMVVVFIGSARVMRNR